MRLNLIDSKIKITDKTQMKPNFTQSKMRIKRKKKTTRGIKAESMSDVEDCNDSVEFSHSRISKSVYHMNNNPKFAKTIFDVHCKPKQQVLRPGHNRRTKT